jgi:hypothetical protein
MPNATTNHALHACTCTTSATAGQSRRRFVPLAAFHSSGSVSAPAPGPVPAPGFIAAFAFPASQKPSRHNPTPTAN